VLISDPYEGGNAKDMLARVAALKQSGASVIVLLALSDQGKPAYDPNHAGLIAAMDGPDLGCTPDQFPDLMAAALARQDIAQWAAANDIAVVRGV
jgi:hypothetical protein